MSVDFDATIVWVFHVCSLSVVQCRVLCSCVSFDAMKRSLNGLGNIFCLESKYIF